ncbi:hypothetical protein G3O08_08555 [Cryomorpha ignava]|uniref:Uncharacterized protein n=1 Tax=Cryomorpha ignava TaxID=101383 RepID=A0A7K3WPG7_9FLAO|nr:hypothetical protein [Cryomorpha ignava]NEN23550.1 hypothetical protein [Cryomorpha ignava]
MKSITIANINTQQHQGILSKYITSKAIYLATKVTLEKAGLFTQVFSLGNCDGLKNIDMDMQIFREAKKTITQEVKDDLTRISKQGRNCLPNYHKYLTIVSVRTTNIKKELDIVRKGVIQYNHNQSKWASLFGKLYSTIKLSADVGIELLSTRVGSAGMAISYMYGLASELATTIAEADKADFWSFSGSLAAPHLLAWDQSIKMVKQPTLGVKVIGGGLDVLPYVLITAGFLDNLAKFE